MSDQNTAKTADKKDEDLRVRTSGIFKLKDKGQRMFQPMDLKKQFGFIPEVIVIEKIRGENNTLRVNAILTAEEMRKVRELEKKGGKNGRADSKSNTKQIQNKAD